MARSRQRQVELNGNRVHLLLLRPRSPSEHVIDRRALIVASLSVAMLLGSCGRGSGGTGYPCSGSRCAATGGAYSGTGGTGATGTTPAVGTGGQAEQAGQGGLVGTGGHAEQGGQAEQAAQGGLVGTGGQAGVGGQAGQVAADDIATIVASYRSWQPLSNAPVDISADIFALCRSPTAAENAFTASAHGRHALRDWANPSAMEGIGVKGASGFATGATIVKEKFVIDQASGVFVLAALGIMVKRSTGFDAAGGDWEFVYWNAADGVSRGPVQLATCTSCHAGAGATDFVFVDNTWRILSLQ